MHFHTSGPIIQKEDKKGKFVGGGNSINIGYNNRNRISAEWNVGVVGVAHNRK